jgi:ubiquinone/menaquinone biosynthesis C-methylase UbiE
LELAEYQRNYDLERHYWWFVGVRSMVDKLLRTAKGGHGSLGNVLDVGCGTGGLLDQMSPTADTLVGVDISPDALHYCSRRHHKNLVLADASSIGLPSHHFDVITAIGVIEHLDDDRAFLLEMGRLLKADGVLILLTSSFPYLWSMHDTANRHKRRYYLRSLEKQIRQNGFETVRFSHFNFFLFPILAPILMFHRLLYGIDSARPQRILPTPPPLVNTLLTWILLVEAQLIRWIRLPWGISLIGVFRKST